MPKTVNHPNWMERLECVDRANYDEIFHAFFFVCEKSYTRMISNQNFKRILKVIFDLNIKAFQLMGYKGEQISHSLIKSMFCHLK